MSRLLFFLFSTFFSLWFFDAYAQAPQTDDSVSSLREVVVRAPLPQREVVAPQRLEGARLHALKGASVADALRYFSGLQIKDYGGIGGLKTIDVRSMGSSHLGVFYDGLPLGNAQNGQTDLGQFSLDNVEVISLYNGQRTGVLQSAAEFGHAAALYLQTRRPQFVAGRSSSQRWGVQYGASHALRLAPSVSATINVGLLNADGKYRFRYRRLTPRGVVAYDTTATRHNGDVLALRGELNMYGRLLGGDWRAKAYVYHSKRGIPGAIVSNVWRRGERQGDDIRFVQAAWQRTFAKRYSTRFQAKYADYATRYHNRDTLAAPADHHYRFCTTAHAPPPNRLPCATPRRLSSSITYSSPTEHSRSTAL